MATAMIGIGIGHAEDRMRRPTRSRHPIDHATRMAIAPDNSDSRQTLPTSPGPGAGRRRVLARWHDLRSGVLIDAAPSARPIRAYSLFRTPDYSELASDIRRKYRDFSGIDHG